MSEDQNRRYQTQLAAVLGTGLFTIAASLMARRSVRVRRYAPKTFDANHIPPKFNLAKDAAFAMRDATFLSVGTFSFGIAVACWYLNVSSLEEFGSIMKKRLGGDKSPYIKDDEETAQLLKKWFGK